MSFSILLEVRKPDEGVVQIVEAAGMLLGIGNTQRCDVDGACPAYRGLAPGSIYPVALLALAQEPPSEVLERLKLLDFASVDDEVAHKVFAKTLTASFVTAGNIRSSQELAPPWTCAAGASNGVVNREAISRSLFGGSHKEGSRWASVGGVVGEIAAISPNFALPPSPSSPTIWTSAEVIEATNKDREVDGAIHALKLAVVSATLCLIDDDARLPLRNRTTAVLVDGSRMSFLALELASAARKFGRCEDIARGLLDPPGRPCYPRALDRNHNSKFPAINTLRQFEIAAASSWLSTSPERITKMVSPQMNVSTASRAKDQWERNAVEEGVTTRCAKTKAQSGRAPERGMYTE